MAGESGPVLLSLPKAMTIAALFGISVFNSIEILFSIFHQFKHRKGLYFWSMLIACIGIPVHATAVLLRMFGLAPNAAMSFIVVLGWWAMVTGQAIVLYSRLHLVSDRKKIRWVLIMIITNFVVLHLPVSALYLAINIRTFDSVTRVFSTYEKIQLTGFSIQESIISGIYIWEASRTLNPILEFRGPRERKITRHLILVNVLVVAMDASLLVTEFTNNFEIQTTYKTVVYSIKLKLEFYVLNQLLFIIRYPNCTCSNSHSLAGYNVDVPNSRRSRPTLQRAQKSDAAALSPLRLESIHSALKGHDREPLNFNVAGHARRSNSHNLKYELWLR
ncbi:integral membrane protein [Paraphaeosphaeria sporulosa]